MDLVVPYFKSIRQNRSKPLAFNPESKLNFLILMNCSFESSKHLRLRDLLWAAAMQQMEKLVLLQ